VTGASTRFVKGPVELRLGRWQDVLADVEPDAVITDPPFSERTAKGFKSCPNWDSAVPLGKQGGIAYGQIDERDAAGLVAEWWPRTRRWIIIFSDHVAQRWYAHALTEAGAYVFAPLPWIKTNGAPRFLGDGPASVTEWITVARRREGALDPARRGSRPGYYLARLPSGQIMPGQKCLDGMRQIVRGYSLANDLICDPCAGSGSTLIAAALEGRRAIGAEMDSETFEKACKRVETHALTPPLPGLE
jgi:site-specific DNA-methyltransferase (adenine-specific)